jgi:hypothetical protein
MLRDREHRLENDSGSGTKLYWIGSAIVLCLALAYVGWVFYSRWQSDRAIALRLAAQRREQAKQAFEGMGGNKFEILAFYASPAVVRRGEESMLCYGVSNAKSVTLQPAADAVWPSEERCVDARPSKTTTYTLTATDAAGHTASATAVVEVR